MPRHCVVSLCFSNRIAETKSSSTSKVPPFGGRTPVVLNGHLALRTPAIPLKARHRVRLSRAKKSPAFAELLPTLVVVPVVDFPICLIFRVPVPFLNFAFELVTLSGDDIQVVVGQLAPLLCPSLASIAFYSVPIQCCLPCEIINNAAETSRLPMSLFARTITLSPGRLSATPKLAAGGQATRRDRITGTFGRALWVGTFAARVDTKGLRQRRNQMSVN
jgi:hypothetical protein